MMMMIMMMMIIMVKMIFKITIIILNFIIITIIHIKIVIIISSITIIFFIIIIIIIIIIFKFLLFSCLISFQTNEEFKLRYLSSLPEWWKPLFTTNGKALEDATPDSDSLPTRFDWAKQGLVTSVRSYNYAQ